MEAEKVAETENGTIITWMKAFSIQKETAICGSVAIKEKGKYYNRFYFIAHGEIVATYNKRHLFTYSGEDLAYEKGLDRVIFEYMGWKICPQICYDLRFPVWFRNTENYDILLNVANWPESRMAVWNTLLQARSIENMCYTIGCNRIGIDGNKLIYNGQSAIYNPLGKLISQNEKEGILQFTLNYTELQEYRKKYPFLEDIDSFSI